MLKKPVFDSFTEYWYYARYLSVGQRKIIFKNLPPEQKDFLDNSFLKEEWSDLFYRNDVNEKIDELKELYGYDILDIRNRVLKGKSVYIPIKFWQVVEEELEQFKSEVTNFIVEGIKIIPCSNNKEVCLVVYAPED